MKEEIKKQIKELQETLITTKMGDHFDKKEIQLIQQKLDELCKKLNKQ
jgi:hypothetical protein